MLRGGGVCVEGPAGSLPKVSPRIRALQDRLLDSLPADGAWECLSPAQREAIISLHRARLTRGIINQNDFNDGVKRQNNNRKNNNNKGQGKGIPRHCRSRSYEDKLESETDDSGVRLASGGGTNSSSTSNSHNSHEDDSSDPGVKKGGRFAKSPGASRFVRKEQKSSFVDFNKQKGVTNGVGNVNKIIAKQFIKSGQICSSNVALDYRNTSGDKTRTKLGCNVLGFESRQHQFDPRYRPYAGEGVMVKKEGISRKNILQRYQDAAPLIVKESTSSEEYDSGVHFPTDNKYEKEFGELVKSRRPTNGIDYDFEFESDQTPRSDSTPSPCFQNGKIILQNGNVYKDSSRGLIADSLLKHNALSSNKRVTNSLPNKISAEKEAAREILVSYNAQLSSKYDYRTHINQEGVNKYSENWNSIVLSKVFPFKAHNNFSSSSLQNSLYKTSASPHGRSVGNLVYDAKQMRNNMIINTDNNMIQDRTQGRKYIRSKSLDRKYLEDTTDDEDSDFEIRRRTDRVRRYAKAHQEWDAHCKPIVGKTSHFVRPTYPPKEFTKPKSKSSWDISDKIDHRNKNDMEENSCFRSRSTILNRWKSEENELSKNCGPVEREENRKDFDKYKWRRRSCDLELEFSDINEGGRSKVNVPPLGDFYPKQSQRRSCDFELDLNDEDEEEDTRKKKLYIDDWDDSVDNEIKILQKRTHCNPKAELSKMYPVAPPREKKQVGKVFPQETINNIDEQIVTRENIIVEQPKRYQIRPEITGRKWSRIEDEHRIVPSHLVPNKHGKVKSPALRSKLRLFKSILPF